MSIAWLELVRRVFSHNRIPMEGKIMANQSKHILEGVEKLGIVKNKMKTVPES